MVLNGINQKGTRWDESAARLLSGAALNPVLNTVLGKPVDLNGIEN